MGPTAEHRSIFGRLAEKISRLAERAVSRVLNGHDARAVGNYMLQKAAAEGRRLTVMHLLKLVYLAHGYWLGLTGRRLIRHPVEAWPLGPVIPHIHEEYPPGAREVFIYMKSGLGAPYRAGFTDAEREIMDMVFEGYSTLPDSALTAITREPGAPWDRVRDKAMMSYPVISSKVIGDYYRARIEAAENKLGNGRDD